MGSGDEPDCDGIHSPPTHRRERSLDTRTLELHVQPKLEPGMAIVFQLD